MPSHRRQAPRVLILATNTERAACVRYRVLQFLPALRHAGFTPLFRPLFDQRMDRIIYQPGRPAEKVARLAVALVRRVRDLADAARADAVVVLREAFLLGPPVLEWAMGQALARPLVYDIDDAVWVGYDSPTYGRWARWLKAPSKAFYLLEHARHTICGNECLARTARAHSRSVSVIPTVVDTDRFVPRPAGRRTGEPLVLGWVGSHSTHNYLKAIEPALATLAHRGHPFRILVVGGAVAGREREPGPDQLRIAGIDVEYRPWTLAREVEDFHDIDIGLFPVIDDDWSAGKSGFKAIQYGATGVPTVTTPVEAHRDIVVDGETGYWATTTEQWVERLEALLRNADLRARLGAAARERIVEGYSLRAQAPRYVDAIRSALG